MKVSIIATSQTDLQTDKHEFDIFGGKAAGVCYMSSSFQEIMMEDSAKTMRRISQTKDSGHHSVYDHSSFSLYLDGIPKILAMILNNEKQYTTSEKSARYTKMTISDSEKVLYDKWLEIFKNKITKKYKQDYPSFFTDSRIEKLAEENARYLTSVFTPTSMLYTVTYRQFNNLIAFMEDMINKDNKSDFESVVCSYLCEFVNILKSLPYYDEKLAINEKHRKLTLFASDNRVEEYYGDVYATTYKATFAELAQAQRHRTINYTMRVLDSEYYIPEILRESPDLAELWVEDIKSLGNTYPQATMLEINEMGTLDNFILKMKERKCTYAQLEINKVTNNTLHKYVSSLRAKNHPRAEELAMYTKGSRCTFPDYKCLAPCEFALGVNESRDI